MGAYPVPYNGGYNNGYNSPIGPQAYDPRWEGWHPWGYGPGYPPGYGGGCCPPGSFPPPVFYPPQQGGGGCCIPGFPCPNCGPNGGGQQGPNGTSPDFNALRNITVNVRNVGNGDDKLDADELEELRNEALRRGDTQTANMASKLMDHYDELNDEGGGFFGFFKHDVGISEDSLYDILASLSEGEQIDSAIAEEAQDHD